MCLCVICTVTIIYVFSFNCSYLRNKGGYLQLGGHWLGCANKHRCAPASCPGLTFPAERAHCGGEIFRIYKRRGSGTIRVGDEVGLYYVNGRDWMSCWGSVCGRSPCPGAPSYTYGMNTWRCGAEVFKVYAQGKSVGGALEDKDTIFLNYKYGFNLWFSLAGGYGRKLPCPGAAYPPPTSKYETCGSEVFEIRKLNFVHIGK